MAKNLLVFVLGLVLIVQICNADLVTDAETALNVLRQATSDNLNGGFLEHIKLATEVDTVALDTKEAGLKAVKEAIGILKKLKKSPKIGQVHDKILETALADVNSCVDDAASQAIDLIYEKSSGLTDKALETTYDEEKKIVVCGRADDACLTGVIDDINADVADLPGIINDEIELDRQAVEAQIEVIKACAGAALKKLLLL